MNLTPTEKLLLQLLKIPSETGAELALANFLLERGLVGFKVQKITVDPKRFNILFTKGTPRRFLVAHIDTVAGQLPVRATQTKIFGRGSCDNKSSVAAMLVAAKRLRDQGHSNFGVLLTVGEDGHDFDGAKAAAKFLKAHNIKPELVVVGEPTGGQVVTGQRGVLVVCIKARGVQAHSSLARPDSAIHTLLAALRLITSARLPKTLVNIAQIHGGVAPNIVAGAATATVSFRSSLPDIKARVTRVLKPVGPKVVYEFVLDLAPVASRVRGFKKREVSFFSEMFFFPNSIICGAGEIKHAHTRTEQVSRAELNGIVGKYIELMGKKL